MLNPPIANPSAPVIIGVGQINHRSDSPAEGIAMMVDALAAAVVDSGATSSDGSLADELSHIRVLQGIWPYKDPGRLIADRVGAADVVTTLSPIGGNEVFDLVADTASRVQSGDIRLAAICSSETLRTRRRDHASGTKSPFVDEADDAAPDEGKATVDTATPREVEVGVGHSAVSFYALAETAIRHRRGESVDEHRARLGQLWARASAVAAGNPNAWTQTASSAEDISTTSPNNRDVSHPYPKLMTSNINVDQSAAALMCSAETAEALGVPRERWIFPHAGVGAADHPYSTNRWAMDESPAMRIAGRRCLDLANVELADCKYVDVYSCFPAAVQLAQQELGLAPDRDFTVTGGLTFAGGPLNSYCMLALVRTTQLLRADAEADATATAFVSGNGGMFSKHSFVVLGTEPPADGFQRAQVQDEVDALPRRDEATEPPEASTLEAYTVTYDREGNPDRAVLSCLTDAGQRWWTFTHQPEVCQALITEDQVGATVTGADNALLLS